MSDRILVHRIAVYGHHGVLAEEQRLGQRFFISLDAELDLGDAGRSDDLRDSVSYADLAALAVEMAGSRRFNLIEALAETLAAEVLANFVRLRAITVRVDKPDAPVGALSDGASVLITRRRDG